MTTRKHGETSRREEARARFNAVRALDDQAAAAALGITVRYVRTYRRENPDLTDHPLAPFSTPESVRASYLAVSHMNDRDAATALRRSVDQVRAYRRKHPDVVQAEPKPIAPPRPGIYSHDVLMVDPSRSSSASGPRVMRVSLPAPPWGGGFERNGVTQ